MDAPLRPVTCPLVRGRGVGHLRAVLRTLGERVEKDGPLAARDAVRLIVRLAKTVEQLHRRGEVHGRLGPTAIALPGPRIASARLRRASSIDAAAIPARPSRDDDAYAVATLLYFALTGTRPEASGPASKLPPLAVFDAGDDALEAIVAPALSPGLAGLRDLTALRRDLEQWLDDPSPAESDALPWEDVERPPRKIDLSSLPPPPLAAPARGTAPSQPDEDERETLPGESPAPLSKRPPRIVPPKIARQRSRPPPLPRPEPEPSSQKDETQAEVRPRETKRSSPRALVAAGGAAAVVVIAYLALRAPAAPDPTPTAANGAGSAPSAPVEPPASPTLPSPVAPSAAVTPGVPSVAQPVASAPPPDVSSTAPAKPPTSVGACLQKALSPDSFAEAPSDVDFICAEADAVKGAGRLRTRIVIAGDGRGVTEGMKEWSLLGGYELAAYAAIRAECCPEAGPSTVPASPQICSVSVESAVRKVAAARAAGSKELSEATEDLDRALRCVVRAKQASAFGGHPRPSGGEGTILKQIFKRMAAKP